MDFDIYNIDCYSFDLPKTNLLVYDPPFKEWKQLKPLNVRYNTLVAFTNFQNSQYVIDKFGYPRFELIWHFKDGRWVSNSLPRITHESIYVYGDTYSSFVGEENNLFGEEIKKGKSCIGSDKNLGDRVYKPHQRKMLNSVLEYPRNMNNGLGCFGKPLKLMLNLIEWLTVSGDLVYDPFMGSGTTGVACKRLNRDFIGIEKDLKYFQIAQNRISQGLTL